MSESRSVTFAPEAGEKLASGAGGGASASAATATATATTSKNEDRGEGTGAAVATQETVGTSENGAAGTAAANPAGGGRGGGSSSNLVCPNCGSTSIEFTDASGHSVCVDCGVVVEENAIVSAVEFVEGTGGASSMVGQFVSATSSKAYTGGGAGSHHHHHHPRGGRYGFSRDSRETTLANGRRKIQEVASRLRLGSHFIDSAHRLFTVAVEKNFVQGRRTTHVVAACLYIACRQEKSQVMLIDFSDALQVNVYTLGTCFLKFRRLLGLKLEIIDPALYVYRFAAHLGLDDKANAVALTALRLVGRMKRDWIVAGRRPAGICAAALLIAARAHGFSKHHSDVTRILRVCGLTVSQRVKEFEQTPSAALTLQQFNTIDLETEADPPVFQRNRILQERAKAIQEGNETLLTSGVLDDPMVTTKRASKWRDPNRKVNEKKVQFQKLYDNLVEELEEVTTGGDQESQEATTSTTSRPQSQTQQTQEHSSSTSATAAQIVVHPPNAGPAEKELASVPEQWKESYPKSKYGRALVLPNHATAEERQASSVPVEGKLNLASWKEDLPDHIDKEVESLFRTDEEERQKEVIFNKLNKYYLAQQERKESERLSAEAASKDQAEEDAAQVEGHARYKTRKSKKRKRTKDRGRVVGGGEKATNNLDDNNGDGGGDDDDDGGDDDEDQGGDLTTEEQLMAAVNSRKISRKINYDALSSIFDDDGSFSTDVVEDANNVEASEDPMFEMI